MRVKWLYGGLHFRCENDQESKWLCQFAELLEGGKFIFEPPPHPDSYTVEEETVSDFG